MMKYTDYFEVARNNETVFRQILRHIKKVGQVRFMGCPIPEDLDTESVLDDIFEKYSRGDRYGIFTISAFAVDGQDAEISIEDIATLSGGGATLRYTINGDDVVYIGPSCVIMS